MIGPALVTLGARVRLLGTIRVEDLGALPRHSRERARRDVLGAETAEVVYQREEVVALQHGHALQVLCRGLNGVA